MALGGAPLPHLPSPSLPSKPHSFPQSTQRPIHHSSDRSTRPFLPSSPSSVVATLGSRSNTSSSETSSRGSINVCSSFGGSGGRGSGSIRGTRRSTSRTPAGGATGGTWSGHHPQLLRRQPWQQQQQPRSSKLLRVSARAEVPDYLPQSWVALKSMQRQAGPTLELTAEAAVLQQLTALQSNDAPHSDHGIEVMYRFASFDPFQRSRYFGPLLDLGQFERFRRLFHHSTYRVLLGHKEHKILSSVYIAPDRLRQRVEVKGPRPGDGYEVFEITMVQREGGSWDGYWFTESVIHDGEGLSRGIAY